jgi:hypothetical protein
MPADGHSVVAEKTQCVFSFDQYNIWGTSLKIHLTSQQPNHSALTAPEIKKGNSSFCLAFCGHSHNPGQRDRTLRGLLRIAYGELKHGHTAQCSL